MPDVYIVAGDKNTRKSSTIRALTGIYNKNTYEVSVNSQPIKTFILVSSLQEKLNGEIKQGKSASQSNFTPTNFPNMPDVKKALYDNHNLLIALWIDGIKNQQNTSADIYLTQLVNAGWNLKGIAVLDHQNIPALIQNAITTLNPTCLDIPIDNTSINNKPPLPANEIASQIRSRWNWC